MEKDIVAGGQELAEARTQLAKTTAALEELKQAVIVKQKELKSIESKIAEETKMLTAFKDELDALDRAIKAKRQEIADGELAIKELEHEIARVKKDQKAAVDAVAKLEKQYSWIEDESQCVCLSRSRLLLADPLSLAGLSARKARLTASPVLPWAR